MEEKQALSRQNINEQFKQLLENDDFLMVLEQVPDIKAAYDEAYRADFQAQKDAFLAQQAAENTQTETDVELPTFKFEQDEAAEQFKTLYAQFSERKKEHKRILAEKEEKNFEAKTTILEKLKALTEKEIVNFGEAFNEFKALQEDWRAIGEVNKARFQSLQTAYSHLIDTFFYNVNIHKDLKNYSFEKNRDEKKKLIEKLQELIHNDSIIQLEHYIKQYQKEWDEIGPTFQEEWNALKENYWTSVNAIYTKIREHYSKIRETQKIAIEKKEQLLAEAKELLEKVHATQNPSQWNDFTQKLKDIQQEWKKTGFSKKEKDDVLWNEFRNTSNQVFEFIQAKFGELNEKRDAFEEQKLALIAQANALKDSKEWKETTEKLIKMQEKWKSIGALKPQKDQKLWLNFRNACNGFFEAKKAYFEGLDDRQADHFKQKETINKAIENASTTEGLNTLIADWWAIGHVPKKDIKNSTTSFEKAVNKAIINLNLDEQSKEQMLFAAKLKAFKKDDNGTKLLENEKRFIKEKVDKLKDEINQFENNLSFFGDSKGAQKLKEVVEKKIAETQLQLKNWQEKLKQF